MRYVITGHQGLIGQSLKKRLEDHECVLSIDSKEGFNVLDLARQDPVKADMMVHLAAQCKIRESIKRPILPHRNNADGAFEVLEFCRKNNIPRIMAASSSRVLCKERNPYTASKVYLEEMCKAYKDCYGIDYIIIRPSTVYGPGKDETSRLMNTFITNALTGKPLEIFGDKDKTLDFTYVDDFVDGVMLSMRQWNEDYNISGGEEKVLDVAQEIIEQTGSKSSILYTNPEIAQPQKVNVDTTKIRKLGYLPKVDIKEGIAKTIQWYQQDCQRIQDYTRL